MRILVADNDSRVRLALNLLLKQEPGEALIAESADFDSLVIQIQRFQPELMLLDWELPGRAAAALLFAVHGLTVRPRVIILSSHLETEKAAQAVGADGFVYKGDPPEKLLNACRQLMGTASSGQTEPSPHLYRDILAGQTLPSAALRWPSQPCGRSIHPHDRNSSGSAVHRVVLHELYLQS